MYRLLRFIDNETNTAPDYEVVLELDKFEESDEILNKFIKTCKEKNLPYSDGYYDYMVIEYACEVPIKAESIFYYKDKNLHSIVLNGMAELSLVRLLVAILQTRTILRLQTM